MTPQIDHFRDGRKAELIVSTDLLQKILSLIFSGVAVLDSVTGTNMITAQAERAAVMPLRTFCSHRDVVHRTCSGTFPASRTVGVCFKWLRRHTESHEIWVDNSRLDPWPGSFDQYVAFHLIIDAFRYF